MQDTGSSNSRERKRGERRATHGEEGRKREREFQYYGRHGNQWLFNDFSVRDAVKRGVGRVFGKEKGRGE